MNPHPSSLTRPYSRLLNFAGYQLLWFTAVLGGSDYLPLLGLLLMAHLWLAGWRRSEVLLMSSVALLGASVDSLLTTAGYFAFPEAPGVLPVPLWLLGIWLGFAGTLRHSMTPLVSRPRLMTLATTVFAPLTYLAAQRLGAVQFPLGNLPTAIAVGLSWSAITPLMLWMAALADGELLRPAPGATYPLPTQEITQ